MSEFAIDDALMKAEKKASSAPRVAFDAGRDWEFDAIEELFDEAAMMIRKFPGKKIEDILYVVFREGLRVDS